ncbi:hypothetical protein GCM10027275_30470 [Rhabdobacter roseus]|uniref:Nucleotide-binding universal stress UspA family protein n=1 Tax=Rhabdobacter roseus TaxID=1655419 RepID=A0A840TNS0_9BACT|nr:universal stress protein [Rhabdobacter roseus]MBB5285004.1 nucleotide-binding universal stress UspA family protein [Rhabdobacter roseus]
MKRILVATDFSANAATALTLAKRIALSDQAVLYLTHVFRPPFMEVTGPADRILSTLDEAEKLAEDELLHLRRELQADGLEVKTDFRYGAAADGVLKAITELQPDLVVLGRTGRGNALDRLLGTVASRVALKAPCPVLVVPENSPRRAIQSIVYATQLERVETGALGFVFELARQSSARITLLKINASDQLNLFDDEQFIFDIRQQFPNEHFDFEQMDAPSVRDGLSTYTAAHQTDLLVVANQPRDWLASVLNPSLSKELVLEVPTPLLVCHLDKI